MADSWEMYFYWPSRKVPKGGDLRGAKSRALPHVGAINVPPGGNMSHLCIDFGAEGLRR